jgi:hypothetical protein
LEHTLLPSQTDRIADRQDDGSAEPDFAHQTGGFSGKECFFCHMQISSEGDNELLKLIS